MGKSRFYKWIFGIILIIVFIVYGFAFVLREGNSAIVTRFGAPRNIIVEAGLHFKLPWPFEKVYVFDERKSYLDTGYVETLTRDKKNVILQTYVVWEINDPLLYFNSIGEKSVAEKYINDMVTNVKNAVLGKYEMSSLVSTDEKTLKIDEIKNILKNDVNDNSINQYGIEIIEIGIKRLGLPSTNLESVFDQMRAERQQYIDQLIAEGDQEASKIINETNLEVAKIITEGKEEAAVIKAKTEEEVSKIYTDAYKEAPEFYKFLKSLEALENTIDNNTMLILRINEKPFNILRDYNEGNINE